MSNSFLSFNKSQDEEDFHCTTFLNDLMDRGHHKFSETSGFATYDESYMQYNSNHHDIQNFPNQFLSSPEPINHQITRLNQQFQTKILKPASKKINKKVGGRGTAVHYHQIRFFQGIENGVRAAPFV